MIFSITTLWLLLATQAFIPGDALTVWPPAANRTAVQEQLQRPAAMRTPQGNTTLQMQTGPDTFSTVADRINWADPHAQYYDGWYYLVYTTSNSEIKLARSRTITFTTWQEKQIWLSPHVKDPNIDWYWYTHNHIWAPALHLVNGVWYVYFTSSPVDGNVHIHRQFVLRKPQRTNYKSPWSTTADVKYRLALGGKAMALQGIENPQFVIDFELLVRGDRLWGMFSAFNQGSQVVYITKMSDPVTPLGNPVVLTRPDYAWEKGGGPVNEAPTALYRQNGQIYGVAFSASGAWTNDYCLGMLVLKPAGNPMNMDHWTKESRPFFKTTASTNIYGPGHNCFFKDKDGNPWIAYHARPSTGNLNDWWYTWASRQTHVQRFTWSNASPSKPVWPKPGSS